jgi:spore coat polysaccharide biosynthesis protein SpsF
MTDRPRVVASIEARMGSSRLPGKVLMSINGKPAIQRLVDRLRMCQSLDDIIIATTTHASDDLLAKWCSAYGVACFRGSEDDVLNRVVEAHKIMESDLVVEITGDCPLTDPQIVDLGIETFKSHCVDIVSNCGKSLTWPMGQYVQVFPLRLLAEVDRMVDDLAVHEHVSLYFYEHPEQYKIIELISLDRWRKPGWRMQLDYPEDLLFQNEVYSRLEPLHGEGFGIEEVVSLLNREPQLLDINRHCQEKSVR